MVSVSILALFVPFRTYALAMSLQDVIALRKRSGTTSGAVNLNGWPQNPVSFRRCSGYVEQFDVQSPELTVRESIKFSAKLRLDPELVKAEKIWIPG